MYYDPFANLDPDLIKPFKPAEKSDPPPAFDPAATEFVPSQKEEGKEEQQWQVVAQEYGGKGVAVLVQDSTILVCTSPSFHSKCCHPGLPCMAWHLVDFDSQDSGSPEPEQGFSLADSGFENGCEYSPENGCDAFTDNSSEQSGEGLLQPDPYYCVEQVVEQYPQHYPAPEPLHVYSPGGDMLPTGHVYSPGGEMLPTGYTTSLPEAIALAPDTVVVEHYPAPCVVQESAYDPWCGAEHSASWSAGLGLNINVGEGSPGAEHYPGPSNPLSPSGQTQFINLGGMTAEMESMQLEPARRRERSEEDRLQTREEQRKREEFKNKVLYNLTGSKEEQEEMKIRDSFKDQVLTNLRKEQQQRELEEQRVKRAFKDKIQANLAEVATS